MLSVELKVSKTFSESDVSDGGFKIKADVTTVSLFGTYSFALSPELTLMPKIGATYFSTSVKANGFGSVDDNNVDVSFGADLKYRFSAQTDMYIGFTMYNPSFEGNDFDANHLSIGVQRHF